MSFVKFRWQNRKSVCQSLHSTGRNTCCSAVGVLLFCCSLSMTGMTEWRRSKPPLFTPWCIHLLFNNRTVSPPRRSTTSRRSRRLHTRVIITLCYGFSAAPSKPRPYLHWCSCPYSVLVSFLLRLYNWRRVERKVNTPFCRFIQRLSTEILTLFFIHC